MMKNNPPFRVISGGQTGVDRAALDAALEVGVACGGWCPDGRLAEDGRIDDRYPLTELPGGGYLLRTLANVMDSDGTLIIYFSELEGGTLATRQFCDERRKPFLEIDAGCKDAAAAVAAIASFVERHAIRALNVAGPRASKQAGAYPYAKEVMARTLAATPGVAA